MKKLQSYLAISFVLEVQVGMNLSYSWSDQSFSTWEYLELILLCTDFQNIHTEINEEELLFKKIIINFADLMKF